MAIINLKANPEYALALRAKYESIEAGFHMNKKHWNSISIYKKELSPKFITQLIDHSYDSVVKGMTRKDQENLNLF